VPMAQRETPETALLRQKLAEAERIIAEQAAIIERQQKLLCPPELYLFFVERFNLTKTLGQIAAALTVCRGVCTHDYIRESVYLLKNAALTAQVFGKYIGVIRKHLESSGIEIDPIKGIGYKIRPTDQERLLAAYADWSTTRGPRVIEAVPVEPVQLPIDLICPPSLKNALMNELLFPRKPAIFAAMVIVADGICTRETIKSGLTQEYVRLPNYENEFAANRQTLLNARRHIQKLGDDLTIRVIINVGYVMNDDHKRKVLEKLSERARADIPQKLRVKLGFD
jgi:hypothetical protein